MKWFKRLSEEERVKHSKVIPAKDSEEVKTAISRNLHLTHFAFENILLRGSRHFVVIDQLVYRIEHELYIQLVNARDEFQQADSSFSSFPDKNNLWVAAYDAHTNYSSIRSWIRQHREPVSNRQDNFDLGRYDKIQVTSKEEIIPDNNLPF